MKAFFALFFLLVLTVATGNAQKTIDREKFFEDTSMINATLTFNMGKLMSKKDKVGMIFPATLSCKSGDTIDVNDQISLEVRGHYRRANCDMPPIKVIFKKNPSAAFYQLKQLKLVNACQPNNNYDQYLLKEYLCYKMYNLISPLSLRARLLDLNYRDSSGKKKTMNKHAFLLEDPYRMAKRNKCIEFLGHRVTTERTDRAQMTLLAVFEYLIGNTDWAVPNYHNIILLQSKSDSTALPIPVGYDFDYCGMVNTDYAVPDPSVGTTTVRERVYRGYPRTLEELNAALAVFKAQKSNMYALVVYSTLLTKGSKEEMKEYLDEFYTTINDPGEIKTVFIDKARHVALKD